MSAAASPAAPPPTITTEFGAELGAGLAEGSPSFSRIKTLSPTFSTFQRAIGSSAGARNASPVRRLKQAWCQGQRTVSPTIIPPSESLLTGHPDLKSGLGESGILLRLQRVRAVAQQPIICLFAMICSCWT